MRSPLVLLGVVLLLPACAPSREEKVEFLVPVVVKEVVPGNVEDRIVATGTLRALQTATLSTETGGTLELARAGGVPLAEGDRVRAGQLIATVTGEDVAVAARTEATERQFVAAEREYLGAKRLYDEGLIAQREVERAEAALASSKVEYDRSRLTEKRTRLLSPIDGVVLKLARDAQGQPMAGGQRVLAGFAVAQIGSTARLIADVDLVGPDAARVREGLVARVRQPGLPDEFEGRVARLAPQVEATTRALRAEIMVENATAALRPGAFVEASIVLDARRDVPVVPRSAVTERKGVPVVFVLKGQKVVQREVALGLGDDRTVELLRGVEKGERIVVQGIETLADGTGVRVTAARP